MHIYGGAAEGHPPTFAEAARGRLLYIGAGEAANAGSVGVGEAANAAKACILSPTH